MGRRWGAKGRRKIGDGKFRGSLQNLTGVGKGCDGGGGGHRGGVLLSRAKGTNLIAAINSVLLYLRWRRRRLMLRLLSTLTVFPPTPSSPPPPYPPFSGTTT